MTSDANLLVRQFDAALVKMPTGQHLSVHRRLVDLFFSLPAYSQLQSAVFKGVIGCLIERSDHGTLLELSRRLAAADQAPAEVIVRLAGHHDIMIANAVLQASNVLTDQSLVALAKTKSPNHVYAIACRPRINELVTNALVERGHLNAIRKAVANPGARFSEIGFAKLAQMARQDRALSSALAGRKDLPPELRPFLR